MTKLCYNMTALKRDGDSMIKNLNVSKKNLTALALACTMVLMSGCSKEKEQEPNQEPSYSQIYMTEYDTINHKLYWDEKTQSELDAIDDSIIAITEEENKTLYVASYHSIGYEAAMKNDTKSEAIKNNPEYGQNASFRAGYDLGKQDKYLKKAEEEQKTYVSIRNGTEEESTDKEANYYPLEELSVISYEDINAIVRGYKEDDVKSGNYEDLLGQDMTTYIGQEFTVTSLREFATENINTLPDALYIVSDDYHHITEITPETMKQVTREKENKTK